VATRTARVPVVARPAILSDDAGELKDTDTQGRDGFSIGDVLAEVKPCTRLKVGDPTRASVGSAKETVIASVCPYTERGRANQRSGGTRVLSRGTHCFYVIIELVHQRIYS
jgi:hypothetical protein